MSPGPRPLAGRLATASTMGAALFSRPRAGTAWRLAEIATLAALYYAFGRLGLLLALPPGHATAVWPPSGLALAAMLGLGYRVWPGIWLGSFLVNAQDLVGDANVLSLAKAFAVAFAIGAGSTAQALLGAGLLQRFTGSRFPWNRTKDVFTFVGIAALACVAAPAVGVTSLSVAGFAPWSIYGETWTTWWLGDLVGVLIVTPLLLIWVRAPLPTWEPHRLAEALLFLTALSAVGVVVFWGPVASGFVYPLVLFLSVAALRFGQRGMVGTAAVISMIAVLGTVDGRGPFVRETVNASLLTLQTFSGIVTVAGLVLAAALLERERAEEALHESEGRLRSFVQHSADGILITGQDGRIDIVNPAAERMFGYEPAELAGQPIEVVVPKHLRPAHERDRTAFVAEAEHRSMAPGRDLHALRKDGSAFPVDVSLTPLKIAGSVTVAAVVRDATARREEEQRQRILIEAGEVLGSSLAVDALLGRLAGLLVNTMADWSSVATLTEEGTLRRAAARRDLVSTEAAQQVERWFAEWLRAAEDPRAFSGCVRVIAEQHQDVGNGQLAGVRRLGLGRLMIVPMVSGQRLTGAIAIARSASASDYTSAEERLAAEVATRAALAIENALLYQQAERIQSDLRRSNETKDEFLGLMSHELRTPMTSIYGGARLLLSRPELSNDARRDVLRDIERGGHRLAYMLENLLTLSRLELGQGVPVEPVLLQRTVKHVIAAYRQHNEEAVIRVHADPALPPVAADPAFLELVIGNLLGNVEKHASPTTPIEVRLVRSDACAVLSVLDRGPGVQATELEKLFDRFYQSGSRSNNGSGLGLTVCKRLIEAQGGRIWAEQREGGGLGISFALPLLTTARP